MIKIRTAALLAGLAPTAPAEAFDFDNKTCRSFVAGIWDGGGEITAPGDDAAGGTVTWRTDFFPDGTFATQKTGTLDGMPRPFVTQLAGRWTAGPGTAATDCDITMTLDKGQHWTETFTVTGPDEMLDKNGNPAKRLNGT